MKRLMFDTMNDPRAVANAMPLALHDKVNR